MIRLHRLVQRPVLPLTMPGDLVLNQEYREVTRGGEQILISPQPSSTRPPWRTQRVVSKSQILIINYDFGGQATLEPYISYLRKKIDGS